MTAAVDDAHSDQDRQAVLACLDLSVRWAIAPFSGARVDCNDSTGVPPWIGVARYLLGLTAGHLFRRDPLILRVVTSE